MEQLELELELEREEMEEKRKRYERSHIPNVSDSQANRIFTCNNIGCKDLEFHSREDIRRHSEVHSIPTCSRCRKVFKSEDSLFEHMNAGHLKIRRPYKCSECPCDGPFGPAIFVSRKQLTDHLIRIHSKRIKRSGYYFDKRSASFLYETEDC